MNVRVFSFPNINILCLFRRALLGSAPQASVVEPSKLKHVTIQPSKVIYLKQSLKDI